MIRRLFLIVLAATAAFAQEQRYIVELAREPVLEAGSKTRRAARTDAVRAAQRQVRSALQQQGVEVIDSTELVANTLTVVATPDEAARIAAAPGVNRVHKVREYKLLLDRAVILNKVTDAWARLGVDQTGAGVKVGIIDTGVDAAHPAFQSAELPELNGFPLVNRDTDLQFTNRKVIVARSYDRNAFAGSARDNSGHGTGVAMIAAGFSNVGTFGTIVGVAPRAYIGSYKVFPDGRGGAPTDLVLKAIDDAVADGMDVINMSLGNILAERPETDILVRAVERASSAGIIVVVAAGNEGPDPNTIGSPATAPSAIAVGNSFNDRIFAAKAVVQDRSYIMVPGNGRNSSSPISAEIVDVSQFDSNGLACSEFPADSTRGRIALILRGTCTFEEKINHAQRAGAVAALVYTHTDSPSASTMAVGTAALPAGMISNADGVELKQRLTGESTLRISLEFNSAPFPVDAMRLNDSSSRGPASNFGVKPEIVAVGTSIYTASPRNGTLPGYTVGSGTSFSSPMVAGAAAALKAARPGLTAAQYRSLLVNSADPFASQPVQYSGAGSLNLGASLRATTAVEPVALSFGVSSGIFDATRRLTITNLSSSIDTYSISVSPVEGGFVPALTNNTVQLVPGASADINVQVRTSLLQPGQCHGFVVLRSSQSDVETRVPYWFGVPSNRARYVTLLEIPSEGRPLSTQEFQFRPTDSSGIPVSIEPVVTTIEGGGQVISVRSLDEEVPGAWEAQVRLGSGTGANQFEISVGEFKKTVTITGR